MPRVDGGIGYEWRSETEYYGYPLVSVAFGRNGKGAMRVAKGWIAIGQFALGVVTFAQFGVGAVFGFGQFMLGIVAIAQFAVALLFGLGQFATGYVAIGQIAFGSYALCQSGFAEHLWSQTAKDQEAVRFFKHMAEYAGSLLNKK